MRNMNLFGMLFLILAGLQMNFLQAADYGVEVTKDEAGELINYTKLYPRLAQGFDILRANGQDLPTFEDFMQQRLAHIDEDAGIISDDNFETNFSEAVMDAHDIITAGMKDRFLQILKNAIEHDDNIAHNQDPIFLYVMKNLYLVFMALAVKAWVNEPVDPYQYLLFIAIEHERAGIHVETVETRRKRLEDVNILLDLGANIEARNYDERTPLLYAYHQDKFNVNIVDELLDRGANKNAQDDDGNTLLHYAARQSDLSTVKKLFEIGADTTIVNKEGKNAEQYIIIADGKVGTLFKDLKKRAMLEEIKNHKRARLS